MNTTNSYPYKIVAHNLLIITCVSVSIGLVACQQEGPAEKTGKKIDQAVGQAEQEIGRTTEKAGDKIDDAKRSVKNKADIAEEYIDDAMITLKVKAALGNDSILKASHIEVATVNGVVTLSGTVDSEQSLGRAMEIADNQAHVKTVQTKLMVNANPGSK
ncbi:MAG: BON domain-containing protein [Methylovulum sp.]|nr:BON domain-containing protein [Methylovulum sp.]